MIKTALALGIVLAARGASAQVETEGERAWRQFDTDQRATIDGAKQDCATACKALESLARAADHICDVAPEHCDEAKARARAAADRVHAACPECQAQVHVETATARPTDATDYQIQVASAPHRGGCAGCAIAPKEPDFGAIVLAFAALVALRRRRATRVRS